MDGKCSGADIQGELSLNPSESSTHSWATLYLINIYLCFPDINLYVPQKHVWISEEYSSHWKERLFSDNVSWQIGTMLLVWCAWIETSGVRFREQSMKQIWKSSLWFYCAIGRLLRIERSAESLIWLGIIYLLRTQDFPKKTMCFPDAYVSEILVFRKILSTY